MQVSAETMHFSLVWSKRMRYHRRRSCASPVLTAIGLVNGQPWEPVIFDSPRNRHTLTDH